MIIKSPEGWDILIENETIISITISNTWEYYLSDFRDLPDRICSKYSFLPGTKDEKAVYKDIVWMYKGLYEWLYDLIPGNKPVNPDLIFSNKVVLKLRAELSKSVFELATELRLRDSSFQEQFNSPAEVWYTWEYQALDRFFLNSGLLTGTPGIRATKEDLARVNREVAHNLENQVMDWSNPLVENLRIGAALYMSADYIARHDKTFRWSEAFRNYIKMQKKWAKAVRSPDWNPMYLENGNLIPNGRKAPRKRKGFVCNDFFTET
jgi:hypothetical protein